MLQDKWWCNTDRWLAHSSLLCFLLSFFLSLVEKHFYPAYLNQIIKGRLCFFHLEIIDFFTWKNLSSLLSTFHNCWFHCNANWLNPWLSYNDNSSSCWEPIFMCCSSNALSWIKPSCKRMSKLIFHLSMNSSRNSELLSFHLLLY